MKKPTKRRLALARRTVRVIPLHTQAVAAGRENSASCATVCFDCWWTESCDCVM